MVPAPDEAVSRPPLSEREFHEIYARVPRLTVEVVVRGPDGILLTERRTGPCAGLWHIPGGTVRFGEALVAAVRRVAADELGRTPRVGPFLGYIEYPSHYRNGLDSPVGLAFLCELDEGHPHDADVRGVWCTAPPGPMHTEQVDFLREHGLLAVPPEPEPEP
jgi:8-oxo-dGTP diphosphatase